MFILISFHFFVASVWLGLLAHHVDELTVVDFAIAILVYASQQVVNFFLGKQELFSLETSAQLFPADGATVILIEV